MSREWGINGTLIPINSRFRENPFDSSLIEQEGKYLNYLLFCNSNTFLPFGLCS